MNTFIIGGTGFIGMHLVADLKKTKRNITIVSRGLKEIDGVKFIKVDTLFDSDFERQLLEQADEVICLAYATKPKTSFENPINDIEENLAQTVQLFSICAKSKRLTKFIYVSSGGAIYGHTEINLICENHPTNPISPYGITKMALEKYANMYHTIYKLPVLIVRPSNAYGPGQKAQGGQGFIAYAMSSILESKPVTVFGQRGTVRDYIYISDLVKGLRFCLDKGKVGSIYNIGVQFGYTNVEVLNVLGDIVRPYGFNINTVHSSERAFDVNRNILNIHKIKTETGWMPEIELKNGLATTWNWLLNNKFS